MEGELKAGGRAADVACLSVYQAKRIEYKEATLRFGRRRILNFEVF